MAANKDNEEKGDKEEGIRIYPDCPADLWSKIHSIPIKPHICVSCDKLMFTDRPFMFKPELTSPTTLVGLTTENNGKHACIHPEAEMSVGKVIFDDTGEGIFDRLLKDIMKKVRTSGNEGEGEGGGNPTAT